MLITKENEEIRNKVLAFDKRIETMHQDFYKYYNGLEQKVPDWEGFERELIAYSRKKILDLELSKNLDRVLFKFQNRKKIWLGWLEESHHATKI
jgi:hypothetical protein